MKLFIGRTRRTVLVVAAILVIAAGIAGLCLLPAARPGGSAIASRSPAAPTPPSREIEPQMPPLIELAADPADPGLFSVVVHPGWEGAARLVVDSEAPFAWEGATPGPLAMRRGDAPRPFKLRVDRAKAAPGQVVRVSLVFEDERGNAKLTYSRELTLSEPGAGIKAAASSRLAPGLSADGRPVQARVPADAPAPRLAGGAR